MESTCHAPWAVAIIFIILTITTVVVTITIITYSYKRNKQCQGIVKTGIIMVCSHAYHMILLSFADIVDKSYLTLNNVLYHGTTNHTESDVDLEVHDQPLESDYTCAQTAADEQYAYVRHQL